MRWRRNSIFGVVLVVVIAIVALIGSNYVFADTGGGTTGLGFDDPYTQIANHEIPNTDKIPIQPDSKPTYTQWGRFYTGPNGVEIRFNRNGTQIATKVNVLIASAAIGTRIAVAGARTEVELKSIKLLSDVAMSSIKPTNLREAASTALNTSSFVGLFDPLYEAITKDDCIGVTIPKGDNLSQVLTRVDALSRLGDIYKLTDNPDVNDIWRANLAGVGLAYSAVNIRVWYEPCSLNEGPKKDVAAPPAPPIGDTQPAVKAAPIPVPAQPAQPVAPVTAPASQRALITHPVTSPPPPAPAPSEACWLAGPDYRSYVKPSDQSYVLFYEREPNSAIQLQVPTPRWMTWTQFDGSLWRLEGAYQDPEGQGMWTEGEFFNAPFWTDGKSQEEIDTQLQAYHNLQGNWGHDMDLVRTTPQC